MKQTGETDSIDMAISQSAAQCRNLASQMHTMISQRANTLEIMADEEDGVFLADSERAMFDAGCKLLARSFQEFA